MSLRRAIARDGGSSLKLFGDRGPSFFELAHQALSSTERGYDLLAPKFDATPFRTPDAILEPLRLYLAKAPPAAALDLCCGTGAVLEVLRPIARGPVVGLDFSRGMLEVARRKLAGSPVGLVRANALSPPFERAFDLVTCFSALGHFVSEEHRLLVRAARGCLRAGGRFVLVTGRMPAVSSRGYWFSRLFNAAMHVRNAIWSPAFTMCYLTFLLPEAMSVLSEEGFDVEVVEGLFEEPFERFVLVDARVARVYAS